MLPTNERSLDELRADSEQTRRALASTVGELRERVDDATAELKTFVSPAHIKQEISDYASKERKSFVASVKRRATDNPLQVAAVGAAFAYPAWGLLRAIPAPLLLIGAGLFLTSKRGRQSTSGATAKIGDVLQHGADQVADATAAIYSGVEDRVAGASSEAEQIRSTVASAAGAAVDQARKTFHDATGAVKAGVGNLTGISAEVTSGVSALARETAIAAKDGAAAASSTSRDSVLSFVNNNTLLVAGVGAALGALLAASIPGSDAETRLFGAGSQKLKDKATGAVTQGIEKARDVVAEAAGSVVETAAREGLDARGVRHALSTVGDSARAVADRGLDTALGAAPVPSQQPATERTTS
jgi:hypothetical protein